MRKKAASDSSRRRSRRPAGSTRPRLVILAGDGLSIFEFSVACEVFGYDRSSLGVAWYETSVCAETKGPVKTQLGFAVEATCDLSELEGADTIIVPPIEGPAPAAQPEVSTGVQPRSEMHEALRRAHARGARIASLCTGAFILAEAGLLDGRRATTHWTSAGRLAATYPQISVDPKVLYIDEGDVLTSAGAAASIDLCLHIVRSDFGAEIANSVARNLVVPPHRDGGQAQFVDTPLPSADDADFFAETLEWALKNLHTRLSVETLASRAAMSPRTFARRFRAVTGTTPHKWLLAQRIARAQRLLEATDFTVDHIADLSGLGTAANLRLHFDSSVGVTPGAYRRTFRGESAA